jgi:adenine phosphoribosyltransferase|tara:strand:+ start:104 stop:646 length:543 start_codon:yes stop_codon:yes gene_type:complete
LINNTEKFLKSKIRVIPNFPKKGIMFQDIFSLIENPKSLDIIINEISKIIKKNKFTKVIGIEARGFIFGSLVAMKNKIPFIPIRKKGKLPGKVFKKKYKLEYGFDQIEIQKNSILKKDRVLIIDDLIATGGTANASADLVKNMFPKKIAFLFVIDLYNLGGAEMLLKKGYDVFALIKTEG